MVQNYYGICYQSFSCTYLYAMAWDCCIVRIDCVSNASRMIVIAQGTAEHNEL